MFFLDQATRSREFASVHIRKLFIKQLVKHIREQDVPLVVSFAYSFRTFENDSI